MQFSQDSLKPDAAQLSFSLAVFTYPQFGNNYIGQLVEGSGIVGRELLWGSKTCCYFRTNLSHYVVFLLKTLSHLQPRETGNHPILTEKLLTGV